jgi:ABC-2 type transport system permease protein
VTLFEARILWLREMTQFSRRPTRILGLFIQPMIWVLFALVLHVGLGATGKNGFNYMQYTLPGSMSVMILASSSRGGMTILRDRSAGFLKEVLVAPVSRFNILLGIASGVVTRSLMQATILMVVGIILGVPYGGVLGFTLTWVGALAVLSLFGIGLVTFMMALAWKIDDMQTYAMASSYAVLPLSLLSGALYSTEGLPAWLTIVASLNPLTYASDALRAVVLGPGVARLPLVLDIAFLAGFSMVCLAFGSSVMRKSVD